MKSILSIFMVAGILTFASCGQSNNKESESYIDTVESSTPLNDNNMRNDQPTDELTKKDSLNTDTI